MGLIKYTKDDFTPYDSEGNSIYSKPAAHGLSNEEVDAIYLEKEGHGGVFVGKLSEKVIKLSKLATFTQAMGRKVEHGKDAIRMRAV